jgi:hypothetical protein
MNQIYRLNVHSVTDLSPWIQIALLAESKPCSIQHEVTNSIRVQNPLDEPFVETIYLDDENEYNFNISLYAPSEKDSADPVSLSFDLTSPKYVDVLMKKTKNAAENQTMYQVR